MAHASEITVTDTPACVPADAPTGLSAEFTVEQWHEIDAIVARLSGKQGALIPVLEEVQGVTGYLPESVQRRVASGLNLPLSQVYGVVTFYSFFTMQPRGRHVVRVCLGTACHVARATDVLTTVQNQLGCEPGELSSDGVFGLEIVRCMGTCGLAPVMQIDDKVRGPILPGEIPGILSRCRSTDGDAPKDTVSDSRADETGSTMVPSSENH